MRSAIVVGAGVFGASLADRLARSGWEVTLVDRFGPGDPRAESGGETRLLRCAHGADEHYARSAWRARELWLELGRGLLVDCGVVWFARREEGWEHDSERVLGELGIPTERLDPGQAQQLYPELKVDDLSFVLHEPQAGVLRAADATRALAARMGEHGGRQLAGRARPEEARVVVEDEDGGEQTLEADVVVWACGGWLPRLFPGLVRLRVTHQGVALFDVPAEWRAPAVPAWVDFDAALYGHGAVEPHGFKAGSDVDGGPIDPDRRPPEAPVEAVRAAREYMALRFPPLAGAPLRAAPSCHYSLTADSDFLFAPHPEHDGVWLLGGGSGHGFKHGPALAEYVEGVLAGRRPAEARYALGERRPSRSLRTAGSEAAPRSGDTEPPAPAR